MSNAFELLSLPVHYNIKDEDIQARYHAEVMMWHPDRASSAIEKKIAGKRSQALNEAYQRLMHPLHRAQEVMRAQGWEATPPDSNFFEWVLDQNKETFQKEWCVLSDAFAQAIQLEDQENASLLYGRMCYIYPRLQSK